MSLQKILEYQTIDLQLYRKEKDVKDADCRKKAEYCKKKFLDESETLKLLKNKLENAYNDAQILLAKLETADSYQRALSTDFSDYTEAIEYKDYDDHLKEYEQFIQDVEDKLHAIEENIDGILGENRHLNDEMDALNADFSDNTLKYNRLCEKFKQENGETAKQLKLLRENIPEKLLETYTFLRKNKKMPAFVKYKDKCCCGCGLDISIEMEKKLHVSGDYAECPHCGRMVYLP